MPTLVRRAELRLRQLSGNLARSKPAETEAVVEQGESDKLAAQTLASVAESRGQQIRDALDSTVRTFQIGAVIFSAAIAAIASNHAPTAVAFLPLPLGLLLAYQQQVYADMMTLAFEQRLAITEFERLTGAEPRTWV